MFIDANVFLYANFETGRLGKWARRVLEHVDEKGGTTSSLVIDEVMWVVLRKGLKHKLRDVVERIYAMEKLVILDVTRHAPLRALQHVEQHGLKPRDALHVAVMEAYSERSVASDDADFDGIPGIERVSPTSSFSSSP